MNILFTLLLFFVPLTAYGSYQHTFEKHIYGNYTVHYTLRIPNPKTPEFVDYIPSLMTIYINSFSVIQYRENNFTLFVKDLSLHSGKVGVRYYF